MRLLSLLAAASLVDGAAEYGIDCSFPIHNTQLSCGDEILGDRQVGNSETES